MASNHYHHNDDHKHDAHDSHHGVVMFKQRFWLITTSLICMAIVANLIIWLWPRQAPPLTLPSYPATLISHGQEIYQLHCASCHGLSGEGMYQASIPALDASMHAWHHPDWQLKQFLRQGLGNMPAVARDWSDDEIHAVLAYIKQWWLPEQLEYQTLSSQQAR